MSNYAFHETFIPQLAAILEPKVYVELGVFEGKTIREVSRFAKRSIGVDIKSPASTQEYEFYEMTSLDYLEVARKEGLRIDLLFIDSEHSHEMSKREFLSFFPLVVDQGIILLHDTYPQSEAFIQPGYCGDVYKTAEWIHSIQPYNCEVVTLPVAPGLSIVRKRAHHLGWESTTQGKLL